MRILVEILHPAHVHVFRNAIAAWQKRGDDVLVVSREKDCANQLLDAYGISYVSISRLGSSKIQLVGEMLVRDWRMLRLALKFKPDVLVGIMGVTIVQVAKLIQRPAIVFYDTENAAVTNRFVYPMAHSVCTPDCYQGEVCGHHVTYPGYHELAYLHPNHFSPDPSVLAWAGLAQDEPFFIVRFVSWQASHDIGEAGFSLEMKRHIVDRLQQRGRVLISSEGELPPDLAPMRFSLPVEKMHHVLAFATILVGESATMASEAAVLGVPALFISDTGRGYTDDEEQRYGLVRNFTTARANEALKVIGAWLEQDDLRAWARERREQLLADKVDTTQWMLDYVDTVAVATAPPE